MEEITVQSNTTENAEAAGAGEWEIDVVEMMQGVVDEAEPAMNAKPEKPAGAESFTGDHPRRGLGRGQARRQPHRCPRRPSLATRGRRA